MSKSDSVENKTIASQNEDAGDEGASNKDKLSIQQILEGMTNEFNKTGPKKTSESVRRVNRSEIQLRKIEKPPIKVVEDNNKAKRAHKCIPHIEEEIKVIKENIPEKKVEKVNKEEEISKQDASSKKDGNIPRIVLTFRTIDENTGHGKKTKISSCASNLSLVPDELANCDQIGGVSVKIENFDEVRSDVGKSCTEETKKQNSTEAKDHQSSNEESKDQKSVSEKVDSEKKSISLSKTGSEKKRGNELTSANQTTEKREIISPTTRRGRQRKQIEIDKSLNSSKEEVKEKKEEKIVTRKGTLNQEKSEAKSLGDSPEKKEAVVESYPDRVEDPSPTTRRVRQKRMKEAREEPGLKRSARRLSKELTKSTVLESAMARKERSNYTEESTKRKYSKPGRPKKIVPDKKDNIPKLNPLDPTKWSSIKKTTVPEEQTVPPIEDNTSQEKKEIPTENKVQSENKTPVETEPSLETMTPLESKLSLETKNLAETEKPLETEITAPIIVNEVNTQEQTITVFTEKGISQGKSILITKKPSLPIEKISMVENPIIPFTGKVNNIVEKREKKISILKKNPPDKKSTLPELSPLDPLKWAVNRYDNMPKLSPLNHSRNFVVVNDNEGCTNLDNSTNKYEGMPKLTPIVKSCEIIRSKSVGIVNNDDPIRGRSLLKSANEPFVKPSTTKLKRERSKGKLSGNFNKVWKSNGIEEGFSSSMESGSSMDDATSEESSSPVKKARRNMAPSPSTAEGQASKPESTAVLAKAREKLANKKSESMQCLCEVRSQLFVTITTASSPLYCTALDSVDSRVVGCCNLVDHDDVAMRRPSAKIPFIILCRMHKDRLIRHNCCPTCGLFCSQGKFVHCSNGHQYHRDCEMYYDDKPLCPHCGSYGLSYDVIITMTGKRKPVSIPPRQLLSKEPSAKITLPGAGNNSRLAEQLPVVKKSTGPLINPNLIKIPEVTINDKSERYTIISLYNAVKNEDVQKLVNVLACGFNANHAFRDQGHRTSLHIAAEKGSLACVHVLAQAGAQLDVLDRDQLSPLMLAASNGHTDVVLYLMRIGADVTLKGEDGMTALHMAAKAGHLEICSVILSECKVPRTLVDSVDDGGWTSLIWACEFRHAEVARFLIDNKCDPLIRDAEQNIALHWSAYSGSSEITELLLNMGCDVNAVNVHGDTPLHIASRQDQYAVSVLLLSRGAKVREVNANGETAIDCCGGDGDTLNALRLNFAINQNADNLNERTVRILTNDISRGKETNPVQCVNGFDYEDKPTDFVYVTENCFTSRIQVDRTITSLQSCRCEDNCSSDKCLCGNISLRCWYDDVGKLVPEFNYADPPMLFECNPACDCNKITCNNRVVQHGLTQRFQLFRTEGKGWGLRTLRSIPKGTYVCEYVGEIISDSEADNREDDSYLFDLDNRDGETFCIDARRYGNIARFINHSCAPNLLPVRVYIEHQDLHFPRIAFFANRDIEADEELGFDYGEKFWIIKCKSFTCTCGAENCRYSENTIHITLDNYRKKIQNDELQSAQAPKT